MHRSVIQFLTIVAITAGVAAGPAQAECSAYLAAQQEYEAAITAVATELSATLAPHRRAHAAAIMDAEATRHAAVEAALATLDQVRAELDEEYARAVAAIQQEETRAYVEADAMYASATSRERERHDATVAAAALALETATGDAETTKTAKVQAVQRLHHSVKAVFTQWDTYGHYRHMGQAYVADARAVLAEAIASDSNIPWPDGLLGVFDRWIAQHYDATFATEEIPHERHAAETVQNAMAALLEAAQGQAELERENSVWDAHEAYKAAEDSAKARAEERSNAARQAANDHRDQASEHARERKRQAGLKRNNDGMPASAKSHEVREAASAAYDAAVAAASRAYATVTPAAQQSYRTALAEAEQAHRERLLMIEPHMASFDADFLLAYVDEQSQKCQE